MGKLVPLTLPQARFMAYNIKKGKKWWRIRAFLWGR
jgi:hypothetical protein